MAKLVKVKATKVDGLVIEGGANPPGGASAGRSSPAAKTQQSTSCSIKNKQKFELQGLNETGGGCESRLPTAGLVGLGLFIPHPVTQEQSLLTRTTVCESINVI